MPSLFCRLSFFHLHRTGVQIHIHIHIHTSFPYAISSLKYKVLIVKLDEKMASRFIVLPVVGKPYILANDDVVFTDGKTDSYETISKIVEGNFKRVISKICIHPIFHITPEWKQVDDYIKTGTRRIYGNVGLRKCSMNSAIIFSTRPPDDYPTNLHGNACLHIPDFKDREMVALGSLQTFKYNENPIEDDEAEEN